MAQLQWPGVLHSSPFPDSDSGGRDPCHMEHLALMSLVSCQGHCDSYNYCSFIMISAVSFGQADRLPFPELSLGPAPAHAGLSHCLQEKPTQEKLSCSGERPDHTPLRAGRIVLYMSSSCASGQIRKQGSASSLHEAMGTARGSCCQAHWLWQQPHLPAPGTAPTA